MEGQELEFSGHIKYLGMIIQSRLSWTAHMLGQIKKGQYAPEQSKDNYWKGMGFRSEKSFVDLYCYCPTKSNLWITSVGSQPG